MDIILTGIPRSGTTLTCYLLNQLPNTIALHEPYNPFHYAEDNAPHSQLVDDVDRFFATTRHSLLSTGQAPSKQFRGQIPDNPKGDYPLYAQLLPNRWLGRSLFGKSLLRKRRAHDGIVQFAKPLSADFTLCVKHNAAYTALLGELTKRYRCYAIIRNPLATLASWNSINFDLREGDMTITKKLDNQLALKLSGQPNRLERQYMIVEWFYSQYDKFLTDDQLIRYETLVAAPTATLRRILPDAPDLDVSITNKNSNRAYNRQLMRQLASMLLGRSSIIWRYYPPEAISQLLETTI